MPPERTPHLHGFVRRLAADETSIESSTRGGTSLGFHVCEKLRLPIQTLMGAVGHRMLLSRALTLAGRSRPTLLSVNVRNDGTLERAGEDPAPRDLSLEDEIVFFAELLALLINFIGAELTLQILKETWPEMKRLEFGEDK